MLANSFGGLLVAMGVETVLHTERTSQLASRRSHATSRAAIPVWSSLLRRRLPRSRAQPMLHQLQTIPTPERLAIGDKEG